MPEEPEVYIQSADQERVLVHRYLGGDYGLEDIPELFQLGHLGNHITARVLTLSAKEVRELKVLADAYGFDYQEEFIVMCLDLSRYAGTLPGSSFCFLANF
jgi:hypothetical protein